MKLAIIFVLAILVVGQEAWAKDDPQVLTLTHKEQLEKSQEIARLVSDVTNGKATVKPSMIPPEIFDRIYFVEKQNQKFLAHADKASELRFYLGQLAGMRDALYIVGILPESVYYSLNLRGTTDEEILQLAMRADRMRLITTMLLLLNYKESNPVPPGNMVQVTAIK